MPDALNHPVAVAYRGRLYVSGGYAGESTLSLPSRALLRYDPGRRRWKRLAPAPTPRAAHAAAAIDGRLYVAGGANDSGSLRSLEIYDIARNRWRSGPDFRGPARNHTTGVASGGLFYVLAGRDARNYTSVDRYDPRRGRWLRPLEMGTARGGVAAARLRDGRIVVFGGEDLSPGGETIPEVELFDPRTRRWTRLPDMRTPRHGLGGAALGNRVFAVEGGVVPGLLALARDRVPRRARRASGASRLSTVAVAAHRNHGRHHGDAVLARELRAAARRRRSRAGSPLVGEAALPGAALGSTAGCVNWTTPAPPQARRRPGRCAARAWPRRRAAAP